ncbi:hypothetical protein SAMD00019534_009950, partial [Acytostelium subglobosum LB1]|uniref:hypothetical protein n=1 Tax=Acytostelium subglobosum LB1 TaxID=1410327 RepID=UPI000644A721
SEARKQRLEALKAQSLEMEREAQEREKRAEERRKAREEQLKQLQEQEKKDEEERQRRREERRRLREEEDKKLKDDITKLEDERKSRMTKDNKPKDTSSLSTTPTATGTSSPSVPAVDDEDAELKRIREEREKRLEERRRQREEAQRQLEEEEKKLAEEREKRRKERQQQQQQAEEEKKKLDEEKAERRRAEKEAEDSEQAAEDEKKRVASQQAAEEDEKNRLAAQQAADEEAKRQAAAAEDERKRVVAQQAAEEEEKKRLAVQQAAEEEAKRLAAEQQAADEKKRLAEQQEEQRRLAEEKEKARLAQQAADEEKQRLAAQQAAQAAEEEQRRLAAQQAAEVEEKKRLAAQQAADEEEEAKRQAAEDEKKHLAAQQAAEEEAKRLAAEKQAADEEKKRLAAQQAAEEEQRRHAAEEEKKRVAAQQAAEEEQRRQAAEDEKKRVAAEQEKIRLAAEEEAKRQAAEDEKKRVAAEQEKARLAIEEENKRLAAQQAAEEEQRRQAAEEEKKRLAAQQAAEEEQRRQAAEDEKKRVAAEEEKKRLAQLAIDEEKKRVAAQLAADEEKKRVAAQLAADEEKKRVAAQLAADEEKKRLAAEKEKEEEEKKKSLAAAAAEKQPSIKVTDQFKSNLDKQLKEKLEAPQEMKPTADDEYIAQKLTSITLDRAKIKGRKLPSKHHRASIAIDPSTSSAARSKRSNSDDSSATSVLSQALEANRETQQESTSSPARPKIVMPPGAAGLMSGMAALALEAQKKKQEKDAGKASSFLVTRPKVVDEPEAPTFVKGRSQSVSVSSTLKSDPSKFLVHKKAVDTYAGLRTRLIQCKGKKRILTREVEVSTKSLNKTDSFVLDCGIENSGLGGESVDSNAHSNIYVWYGSKSSAAKKSKAVGIAEIIKSHERGGHATIHKIDEGDKDSVEFFRRINGKFEDSIAADGGDDLEAEQTWVTLYSLLKYDQAADQLVAVDAPALSMELLASDSFFVLDTVSEYYAWSGRNADLPTYKDKFVAKAKERMSASAQRPSWVEIVVTSEGGEPVMFREKFFDWPDLSHEVSLSRMGFGKARTFDVSIPYEKKAPAKMSRFDIQEMVNSEPPEEAPHRSDGSGTYEMWYVENNKIHPIPKEEYGQFYSSCCYLIKYTYTRWNALRYIIYIWQGLDASRQEVGMSTLLSKDMYIATCNDGDCFQEAIRQGRETVQFSMIFNGRMVVHRGVRGEYDFKSKRLYHVHGKRDTTNFAIQMSRMTAAALNSRDIFFATDSNTTYQWVSKGASKVLKEQADKIAPLIVNSPSKSATVINEGSEPEEFWKMLGGKHTYANGSYLLKPKQTKLFSVNNTGTIIRADEIFNFNQYELQSSRCYILDNKVIMYVWAGSKAPEKEKKRAMEIALEYLEALKDGRKQDAVIFIKEKEEPVDFTCEFHAWDTFRFLSINHTNMANTQSIIILQSNNIPDVDEATKGESAATLLKKYYQTLPLEELMKKNTPPEIDRSVLEMYLSEQDFQKVLGMQRAEWDLLPGWKKTDRKKSVGLF